MSSSTLSISRNAPSTTAASTGRPWGFWATLGLALVVNAAFILTRILVGTPFRARILGENPGIEQQELFNRLQNDGLLLSLSTLAAGIIGVALILLFARLRRGIEVHEYLPLTRPGGRTILIWLAAGVGFVAVSDGLKLALGYPLLPEFVTNVYASAVYLPLLWLAVIVVAPLFEEYLFRGFLFAGWSRSKLGVTGTILLTSALWAAVHTQYDAYYVAAVFAFGVLAGIARHRTGSLWVPILIHAVVNLIIAVETALVVGI